MATRPGLRTVWLLEVDDAVVESFIPDGLDGGDQWFDAAGSPREPRGERHQEPVVAAGVAVLCGDSGEVSDVLGEHDLAAGHRRRENLAVRAAPQFECADRDGFGSSRLQTLGQGRRVHLVEEELHRVSAAAVSLR